MCEYFNNIIIFFIISRHNGSANDVPGVRGGDGEGAGGVRAVRAGGRRRRARRALPRRLSVQRVPARPEQGVVSHFFFSPLYTLAYALTS